MPEKTAETSPSPVCEAEQAEAMAFCAASPPVGCGVNYNYPRSVIT